MLVVLVVLVVCGTGLRLVVVLLSECWWGSMRGMYEKYRRVDRVCSCNIAVE